MRYFFIRESGNKKIGRIAATYTSEESCPDTCAWHVKGCYSKQGPSLWQWRKAADTLEELLSKVDTLLRGSMLRWNVGGDLPGLNTDIDKDSIKRMAKVAKRRKLLSFLYTHKKRKDQIEFYKTVISDNFVINLSCDSLSELDKLKDCGLPLTVVLPTNAPKKQYTPGGVLVIGCPAEPGKLTCGGGDNTIQCGGPSGPLCLRKDRKFAVGFFAHGVTKKHVDAIIKAEILAM